MVFLTPTKRSITSLSAEDLKEPTYTFNPQRLKKNIDAFTTNLPIRLLYPVKANAQPFMLKALNDCGIYHFDVASLYEIELVHQYAQYQTLYYMHPVKPRHAIHTAYFKYGIKHFAFDSEEELKKIFDETGKATDLILHLRVQTNHTHSKINLSDKFGAPHEFVHHLLENAADIAEDLGVCLHVGSQCLVPADYFESITAVKTLLENISVPIKYFDIGGGLPSRYLDSQPPPLTDYFEKIKLGLTSLKDNYVLLAEPGRSLVAETMSLIVRVDLRKGNILYINAGIYGGLLLTTSSSGVTIPARKIKPYQSRDIPLDSFSFYGPTCDSTDFIKGPIYLPSNVKEGDYIELGQMGAYAEAMSTNFNGFSHNSLVIIVDTQPMISMYEDS